MDIYIGCWRCARWIDTTHWCSFHPFNDITCIRCTFSGSSKSGGGGGGNSIKLLLSSSSLHLLCLLQYHSSHTPSLSLSLFLSLSLSKMNLIDSATLARLGDTVASIKVELLPPRAFCKIRVSLLSRYGMWELPVTSALIQLPRHDSDRLMLAPLYEVSAWGQR